MGGTYGGRGGRRWQGDEERGTGRGVRELSPEVGREGNVCVCGGGGRDGAFPPVMCSMCAVNC